MLDGSYRLELTGVSDKVFNGKNVTQRRYAFPGRPEVLQGDRLTLRLEFIFNYPDVFEEVRNNMVNMFENPKFSDCVVECNGKEFPCHKCILACGSEVFSAALTSGMVEEKESRITIPDFDALTVEGLLRFIYGGSVECLKEKAQELLAAADKYNVKGLKGGQRI